MIISASRRTDIPCYYGEWFCNRIQAGSVLTRNPMNHQQLSRISLSPQTVDCIVFWTKDPLPFLPRLPQLDTLGYHYYFQFTLTPYGQELEKNLRPKEEILETFQRLSQLIGPVRTLWRYDPIILNEQLTLSWHLQQFEALCRRLEGYTHRCTISFVDLYAKLKPRYRGTLLRELLPEEMETLCRSLSEIGRRHGISLCSCSEKRDFSHLGVAPASCIDQKVVEQVCGYPIQVKADRNQRAYCRCVESVDIGAYNSCLNGCLYCYANYSGASVAANCATHHPMSEILIGGIDGKITQRSCQSLRLFSPADSGQLFLFDSDSANHIDFQP